MPAITICTPENTPGRLTRDEITDPAIRARLGEGDLDTVIRYFGSNEPSQSELFLLELTMVPDSELEPHGHRGDEVLYILEGEMHLGSRTVLPGSSIHIPAMTAYHIKAGPNGVRFLNFFGNRDGSEFFLRDELIKMRGSTSLQSE